MQFGFFLYENFNLGPLAIQVLQCQPTTAAPKTWQWQPPISPHLKMNMALDLFQKATNYASLGTIVKDSYGSLIIIHTELIPCQRLWMAATAMQRASHMLI